MYQADTSLNSTRRHMVVGSRQAANAFEGLSLRCYVGSVWCIIGCVSKYL